MKTKPLLIGATLIATALLTSCQQEALPVYSCDPEINKWANENVREILVMTRTQFLELDANYQRAAFNAFTPQQRVNVWKTKLEETLQLEWTTNLSQITGI
jgi:Spy/CpxP family protein refolding chaperone